jgi:hypothetical protein
MLLYHDITKALTTEEEEVVNNLQVAALRFNQTTWDRMIEDPLIKNLIRLKILHIGTFDE